MHPLLTKIQKNIAATGSYVCVGLDPDVELLPHHLPKTIDGVETFLRTIIEVTASHCIAFKANISFFESLGIEGLTLLSKLRSQIPSHIPLIIDGKRGDIGNTAKHQATFLFDHLGADASTLNPYMGLDALAPFFNYKDKLHFVLALTSNPGANDFERVKTDGKAPFYETVMTKCSAWNATYGNIGCVVGATQSELPEVRQLDYTLPYLIPGVGAQGGSYSFAVKNGKTNFGVVLVNIGRSIIYASHEQNFGAIANQEILRAISEVPLGQ